MKPMQDLPAIERFLACRRLALVGVSRDPKDFSRGLLRELLARGYDVAPVNPFAAEIEGRPCRRSVKDVEPAAEAALLMTAPSQSEAATRDCLDAGVRLLWFHRGGGGGAASPSALALCRERGATAVPGACPYMFLKDAGWVHRVHGFLHRVFSRPAAA